MVRPRKFAWRSLRPVLLLGALGALMSCCVCVLLGSPRAEQGAPLAFTPAVTIIASIPAQQSRATATSLPPSPTPSINPIDLLPTLPPTLLPLPTLPVPPTQMPVPTLASVLPVGASAYACLQGLIWEHAELVAILDGDTIDVRFADGRIERVRYIGVDTPEQGDRGYLEATQANTALLNASPSALYLARDVSDRDRFGRLLRYVVSAAGSLSHELVRQGWARMLTIPPDVRCADELVALQQDAQATGRGGWGAHVAVAPLSPTPTTEPPPASGCHPAYPDVCIPPPPPDLNCRDIPFRRFTVLPPDPHGFDRDGDGIGCER